MLKVRTHQTDIKELAAMKANCCVVYVASRRPVSVAFEHTTRTTSDGQVARTFCACVRESGVREWYILSAEGFPICAAEHRSTSTDYYIQTVPVFPPQAPLHSAAR